MKTAAREFWNPVTKTKVVLIRTPDENGGRELVVDWIVAPGERIVAAAHVHPGPQGVIAERFDLLQGGASCRIGRSTTRGTAPHVWEVPCNAVHVHPWSEGGETMHLRQTIQVPEPDMALLVGVQRYFETLVALSQRGLADRKGNIRGPLQNALTLYELLLPGTYLAGLPHGLQRAALRALASLARRRGLSAYHAPNPGVS